MFEDVWFRPSKSLCEYVVRVYVWGTIQTWFLFAMISWQSRITWHKNYDPSLLRTNHRWFPRKLGGFVRKWSNLTCAARINARWATTTYKCSYDPFQWPYTWLTGVITLINGVMTPFTTVKRPTLWRGHSIYRRFSSPVPKKESEVMFIDRCPWKTSCSWICLRWFFTFYHGKPTIKPSFGRIYFYFSRHRRGNSKLLRRACFFILSNLHISQCFPPKNGFNHNSLGLCGMWKPPPNRGKSHQQRILSWGIFELNQPKTLTWHCYLEVLASPICIYIYYV